jgi:alpha-amylase
MQGFYWNVPKSGKWYNIMANKAKKLSKVGFDSIWFPPPCKGMSGKNSMGYDLFDHYDLGNYNQKGTIQTRFGTKEQLKKAIKEYHKYGINVYVDVVMNHMMGGELENNPYNNEKTYTKFKYKHSKFEKNYKHFHPNKKHNCNHKPFYGGDFEPSVCFEADNQYMFNGLVKWCKWLYNEIGFDGYRLDFVKGIQNKYLKKWKQCKPMNSSFTVGEYWDGDDYKINKFINETNIRAFDFNLFYILRDMCNNFSNFDMRKLVGVGVNPNKSVTFVENHDTDRECPIVQNKIMAYAYILMHEGYPTVFWKDYYNYNLKHKINKLISLRKKFAKGNTVNLFSSTETYIAQRTGDPGVIFALNNGLLHKNFNITTKWKDVILYDYINDKEIGKTNKEGQINILIPPQDYIIVAPKEV